MSVTFIGLGYIGLPTAALLASKNISVAGVDINPEIVEAVNNGRALIEEPGLQNLVRSASESGKLQAFTTPQSANIYVIAVPTPLIQTEGRKEANVDYVLESVASISKLLKKDDLIIVESTCPVGTTEKICKLISKLRDDLTIPNEASHDSDLAIAYCPERVIPGKTIDELQTNSRIIGGVTPACSERAKKLYEVFSTGELVATDAKTAELAKLAENAYRDVNIAYANELSYICDDENIDVSELIKLTNRHPRVNILSPGPGVGGHCIAIDPWFIVQKNRQISNLIRQAREINDSKPDWIINKVKQQIDNHILNSKLTLETLNIAVLGITYKPNIDDVRESPALYIANELHTLYATKVSVVDPNIASEDQPHIRFKTLNDLDESINVIIKLVNHKEFDNISCSMNQMYLDFSA